MFKQKEKLSSLSPIILLYILYSVLLWQYPERTDMMFMLSSFPFYHAATGFINVYSDVFFYICISPYVSNLFYMLRQLSTRLRVT